MKANKIDSHIADQASMINRWTLLSDKW